MADSHYTFHIYIMDRSNIRAEIVDPDNNPLGSPKGRIGYYRARKTRERIQALHQLAVEKQLTGAKAKELGELLFDALFDDELRRDFFSFYEEARRRGTSMRIELDVDEQQLPEVAALPWEFLYAPSRAGYGTVWLSTAPDLVFSRYRAIWRSPPPIHLKASERLRIALAVAHPTGEEIGEVKYEGIWNALQDLARLQAERIELLDLVDTATTRTIDALLERKPHIFHFIGHGRLRDSTQRNTGQLALVETVLGGPDWIDADRFSELFTRHRPGVILLQACEGAMISTAQAFTGVASQLVQQNIPVVVAMQYEVSNITAQQFALEFYERLARNDPVDKAAQEGRRRIAMSPLGYESADFATPVLFMRVPNGRLFQQSLTRTTSNTSRDLEHHVLGSQAVAASTHTPESGRDSATEAATPPNDSAMLRLEEYLETKLLEDFVNREWAADLFLQQVRATRPDKPIIFFYGVGGVGKTSLLLRIKGLCRERGFKFGMVDSRTSKSVIDVLQKFRKDLLEPIFNQFDTTIKKYDDINRRVRSSVERDIGSLDPELSKDVPSGALAAFTTTASEQEVLGRLQQALGENEIEFYTKSPIFATQDFTNALKKISQKIVLIFDTFEEVSDAVDEWLTNVFLRGIGSNIQLVIAGRGYLSDRWNDWQPLIAAREVKALGRENVEEFLKKQRIVDPKVVKGMMNASEGLPWALSLLVESYKNELAEGEVINPSQLKLLIQEKVIDRFLRQIKDEPLLNLVNAVSVVRRFNVDIIAFLLNEKSEVVEQLLENLKRYTLIQRRLDGSLSLHDIVRDFLEKDLHDRSPETWERLHKRAYNYYASRQKDADTWTDRQIYLREMLHHQLLLNEKEGISLFHSIFAQVWNIYRLDLCNVFLTELENHELSREGKLWVDYYRGRLAHISSNDIAARRMFKDILSDTITDRQLKAAVLLALGKVVYHGSEFEYAEHLIQESVLLRDEDTIGEALNYLGKIHSVLGQYDKALHEFIKAEEVFEQKIDTNNLAWIHYNKGNLYKSQLNYEEAQKEYEEGLRLFEQLGHKAGEAMSYLRLGKCFLLLNHTIKAEEYLLRSKALVDKLNDNYIRMLLLTVFGDLKRQQNQINEAKSNYLSALEIVREYQASAKEAIILRGLCDLSLDIDDLPSLQTYADRGLNLALEKEHLDMSAWFYLFKGHVSLRRLLIGEPSPTTKPTDEYFKAFKAAFSYSKYLAIRIAKHLVNTIKKWFAEKQADLLVKVVQELLSSFETEITTIDESSRDVYQLILSQLETMRKSYNGTQQLDRSVR